MSRKQGAETDFFEKYDLRLFVTVPIVAKKEKIIAVVIIDNPVTRKSVTQDDLGLLQLFATRRAWPLKTPCSTIA